MQATPTRENINLIQFHKITSRHVLVLEADVDERDRRKLIHMSNIITMARKTAANPDAYCLDLRVRLSVGCKRHCDNMQDRNQNKNRKKELLPRLLSET